MRERLKCVGEHHGRQVLACLGAPNDCNEIKAQKGPVARSPGHPIDLISSLHKRAITHLLDFGGGGRRGGREGRGKRKKMSSS